MDYSQSRYLRRRRRSGFTMLETILIFVVIGVLAVLVVPSFSSLFTSLKLDQTITEVRTTLSSTQRSAIRNQKPCVASFLAQNVMGTTNISSFQFGIMNGCERSLGHRLPEGISVVSNIIPNTNRTSLVSTPEREQPAEQSDSLLRRWWEGAKQWACENWGWCRPDTPPPAGAEARVIDVVYGAQGTVAYDVYSDLTTPADMTGKFVVFPSHEARRMRKCVAISRRIGLTRVGNYHGQFDPAKITDDGRCTSEEWSRQ